MSTILDKNLENKKSLNSSGLDNGFNQNQSPKSEKGIVNTLGQILPFAPLLFEQFTGQKIAQPTGTIAEIQTNISQLTISLQQVIANQQQIFTKITNLETNANNQLLGLDRRLENLQSLKLTHERESKRIEYNNRPKPNGYTKKYH